MTRFTAVNGILFEDLSDSYQINEAEKSALYSLVNADKKERPVNLILNNHCDHVNCCVSR